MFIHKDTREWNQYLKDIQNWPDVKPFKRSTTPQAEQCVACDRPQTTYLNHPPDADGKRKSCGFGGISALAPDKKCGIDNFGVTGTPKKEFAESNFIESCEKHLRKGNYCWTCQRPTVAEVPGWKRTSRRDDSAKYQESFLVFLVGHQKINQIKVMTAYLENDFEYIDKLKERFAPQSPTENSISYVMTGPVTWANKTRDEHTYCLHCGYSACPYPVLDRAISPLVDSYKVLKGASKYWSWTEKNMPHDSESGNYLETIYANLDSLAHVPFTIPDSETALQKRLRDSLQYLTELQRNVWELKNDKTALRSDEEIGKILNIKQQTVNKHFHSAENRLKKLLSNKTVTH